MTHLSIRGARIGHWTLTGFFEGVDTETMLFAERLDLRSERSEQVQCSFLVFWDITLEDGDEGEVRVSCLGQTRECQIVRNGCRQ